MATAPLPLTVPDVVCYLDVDAFGRETASDLETLAQDVFHRLLETPGSNIDDPSLGIGVEEMLSGGLEQLDQVTRRIDQQLAEDPRIDAVTSTLTKDAQGVYTLGISIQASGTVTGLVFSYTAAGGLLPA
jgi:hypothetical protein